MPRESEKEQSTQHGNGTAGTSQDIDFDAEHSPATSRRASSAVLRHKAAQLRTADASSVANATPDQRDKQREKADHADLLALQSAIMLVAKHLDEDAAFIYRTIMQAMNASGEAGASPMLQMIDARAAKAISEMEALSGRIPNMKVGGSMRPEDASLLAHELGALRHGVYRINTEIMHAKSTLANREQPLAADVKPIRAVYDVIRADLKLDGNDITLPNTQIDARPEVELFQETLQLNLTAAYETARSLRMDLGKDDRSAPNDLRKLARHIGEVADLVRQSTDPKQLKPHKQRAQVVLTEIHGVEKALENKPVLMQQFRERSILESVSVIESKLGHR